MRRGAVAEPAGRLLVGLSMVLVVSAGVLIGCSPPKSEAPPESEPSGFALTAEERAAGSARFEVHVISEPLSFPPRDHRVMAEVTTPETEPARVVEALMRAAVSVHRESGFPFAVMVRLWDGWPNADSFAKRVEVYALDGCGWSNDPPRHAVRCSGPVWTFERDELPAWMLRDSPDVLTNPLANGWSLRVWW